MLVFGKPQVLPDWFPETQVGYRKTSSGTDIFWREDLDPHLRVEINININILSSKLTTLISNININININILFNRRK